MKKFLVSVVALFAATSAFAADTLSINIDSVQKKTVAKGSQGPAFSSKSFFAQPVVGNNGQIVGLDLAVLVDKYDQNLAILRPLGKYEVAGVNFSTVFAASATPSGKQVYGGLGVMADFGTVVPGFKAKVGGVARGANLSSGVISNDIVPAVQLQVDAATAYRHLFSTPSRVEKTFRKACKDLF